MISFSKLFTYQPLCDKTLVFFGVFMGVAGGAIMPMMALIFGELIDIFDPRKTDDEVAAAFKTLAFWIAIISSILWITGYFQYAFLQHMAEKLSFDLRSRYLNALLKQETAYFERNQVEALPSQIADHFHAISEGIGEKVGQAIYAGSMGIGGLAISFYISWTYTLIAFAYMPFVMIGYGVFGKKMKVNTEIKMNAVKEMGSHTEETLAALKLVVSFNREELACKEFDAIAEKTKVKALAAARALASMMGFFMCTMFGFFCYSYFIGSLLIQYDKIEPGTGKPYTIKTIVAAS